MSKHNRGPSLSCIICRSVVATLRIFTNRESCHLVFQRLNERLRVIKVEHGGATRCAVEGARRWLPIVSPYI